MYRQKKKTYFVRGIMILGIAASLLSSCHKDPYDVLVPVSFEWTDDVSPQMITFSVNGKYNRTEWTVNSNLRSDLSDTETKFADFMVGESDGIARIVFNGFQDEDAHYYGELNLEMPGIANLIELQGITCTQFADFIPMNDLNYIVKITYSDGKTTKVLETTYNPTLAEDDEIMFSETQKIEIGGFEKKSVSGYSLNIALIEPEKNSLILQKKFMLYDEYYETRKVFNNRSILEAAASEPEKNSLFLMTDWKRK